MSATVQVPLKLTAPDAAGNAVPALIATANIRQLVASFVKDVDGSWYGSARVPQNYASGPKILLNILATATSGVTRLNVHSSVKGDADGADAALTAETAQDITVPGTAYMFKKVTFTLATTPVAGKELIVRIQHDGAHANDTLAVDTLLWEAVFEYTTT